MTNRIPVRRKLTLFHIGKLFTGLIQQGFCLDDQPRNLWVRCFGARGVDLAEKLLNDKFQGSADRGIHSQSFGELTEVALDARNFLRDIATLGKKCNLRGQASLVWKFLQGRFCDSGQQVFPVAHGNLRSEVGDFPNDARKLPVQTA